MDNTKQNMAVKALDFINSETINGLKTPAKGNPNHYDVEKMALTLRVLRDVGKEKINKDVTKEDVEDLLNNWEKMLNELEKNHGKKELHTPVSKMQNVETHDYDASPMPKLSMRPDYKSRVERGELNNKEADILKKELGEGAFTPSSKKVATDYLKIGKELFAELSVLKESKSAPMAAPTAASAKATGAKHNQLS